MTKIEIEQRIAKETQELSMNALQEVTDSLVHLEEEFANYKLLYPFKEPGWNGFYF